MSSFISIPSFVENARLGKFRFIKQLGHGGMGEVWLAEDTTLGRNVALKVILPEFALRDDIRLRFLQEARSAAQVEHERIVRIFEVGEDQRIPYIAMELLKGEDLFTYLGREPVPPLSFTLKVVAQVLHGISAAHTHPNQLIHRDIKPQNVWLENVDGKGKVRCKILDFGIAKPTAPGQMQTQTIIGTLEYMSEEQLRGAPLDPRADLYSVGVMLYQMLTGRFPYLSKSAYLIGMEMRDTQPPPPKEVNSSVPQLISDFTVRMISVKRDGRPVTALDAIAELEAIVRPPKSVIATTPPSQPAMPPVVVANSPDRKGGGEAPETLPPPLRSGLSGPTATAAPVAPLPVPTGGFEWVAEAEPLPPPLPRPTVPPRRVRDETLSRVEERTEIPEPKPWNVKGIVALLGALALIPLMLVIFGRPGGSSSSAKKELPPEIVSVPKKEPAKPEVPKVPKVNPEEKKLTPVEPPKVEPKVEVVKNDPKPVPKVIPKKVQPESLNCTGEKGADAATVKRVQQEWADYLGVEVETSVDLGSGVKIEFVLVPPGKFTMGSNDYPDAPTHPVTLTKAFYLAKYEMRQAEYVQLLGVENPSRFKDEVTSKRHPVENVTWNDAKVAWEKLATKNLPRGFKRASLPTEAQWEYACRAGTKTNYHFGDKNNGTEANCDGSVPDGTGVGPYRKKTTPVGNYMANALGLFDMHGNVWEWCLDGYTATAYKAEGRTDPEVADQPDKRRCLRGGSWYFSSINCRSAHRSGLDAGYSDYVRGFRLALLPLD